MPDATAFQPYQNPLYQQPQPWANANTYAPWDPDGAGPQSGQFDGSSYGQGKDANYNYGGLYATSLFSPISALIGGGMGLFGTGKKRSSPNFYAPSYQGNLFTPAEGMPQWYGTSSEGAASDSSLQTMMGGGASTAPTSNSGGVSASAPTGASGLQSYSDSTMPSYIGQSPWLGNTVNNYSPNIGGNYGGYDTYGGYGNSQSKTTSQYQPYVPTGYSATGQY